MAKNGSEVPAYIEDNDFNDEMFSGGDIEYPQIKIAQSMSPEMNKEKNEYVKGLEIGQLFNSISKEVYGDTINFTPLTYWKENIDFGEGLLEHFCYVLMIEGDPKNLAVLAMKSTGAKTAKRFNALVKMRERPMYSQVFVLGTSYVDGDKGAYYVHSINQNGWVNEKTYNIVKPLSEGFKNEAPKIGWKQETEEKKDDVPY